MPVKMLAVLCICLIIYTKGLATQNYTMSGKIVGGQNTDINDYPFSAALTIKCQKDGEASYWFCGASIVNQRLLLTAAHCVSECTHRSFITANLGNTNKLKGTAYLADSFLTHENYVEGFVDNDIALIKLQQRIVFNSMTSRVALMDKPPYKEMAHIAGWGAVSEDPPQSTQTLKTVGQRVLTREECKKLLNQIPSGSFCAFARIDEGYVAVGDSGSPLVVRNYIQIGITSFKRPALATNVAVYTDTGYFYNWIVKNAKYLSCEVP